MGSAATKIGTHMAANFLFGGFGFCVEQSLRAHHHARNAITALRGFLIDEGLLQFVWLAVFHEAFGGGHLAAGDRSNREDAGESRATIHMHHAGAALTETAPEFRAVQAKIVSQNVKQRRRRVVIDFV